MRAPITSHDRALWRSRRRARRRHRDIAPCCCSFQERLLTSAKQQAACASARSRCGCAVECAICSRSLRRACSYAAMRACRGHAALLPVQDNSLRLTTSFATLPRRVAAAASSIVMPSMFMLRLRGVVFETLTVDHARDECRCRSISARAASRANAARCMAYAARR